MDFDGPLAAAFDFGIFVVFSVKRIGFEVKTLWPDTNFIVKVSADELYQRHRHERRDPAESQSNKGHLAGPRLQLVYGQHDEKPG